MIKNRVSSWARSAIKQFSLAEYLLLGYVFSFVVGCYSLAFSLGQGDRFRVLLPPHALSVIAGGLCLCGRAVYVMIVPRPRRLFRYLYHDFRENVFPRVKQAVVPALVFLLFTGSFSSMKSLIPMLNYYCWDEFFFKLDRALHLGFDPWRISHLLFGHPLTTFIIDLIYNVWFLVCLGVMYWQLFSLRNPRLRMQFLYSFFLCWTIMGILMATIFSSVGPCFYGEFITTGSPYEPLMSSVHEVNETYPLWAVNAQDYLLERFRESKTALGSGISAMPSLHVSIAFLMFLVGFGTSRSAAIGFGLFAIAILIGSVHLGWHYAVDGYFSILLTWLIWCASGAICDRLKIDERHSTSS